MNITVKHIKKSIWKKIEKTQQRQKNTGIRKKKKESRHGQKI